MKYITQIGDILGYATLPDAKSGLRQHLALQQRRQQLHIHRAKLSMRQANRATLRALFDANPKEYR